VDNGCGIAATELGLAFERHATSKLANIEDLEAISSLGFRGEALPSIAAVSRVSVRSRFVGEATGVSLTVLRGDIVDRRPVGLPYGTTVEVTELFDNLPVRRKFLKGRVSESAASQQVALQYALANPLVDITLVTDGQTMFSTSGARTVRDVVACLYGVDLVDDLVIISGERHGVKVTGLVSRIGHTRGSRNQQSFFVNGRWVRNRILNVALEEGYHSMLMGGRHPVAVILLQLPPGDIDVNVHPAKTEIRFLHERDVFGAIRHTVNTAIATGLMPPGEAINSEQDAALESLQLPLLVNESIGSLAADGIAAPARAMPTLRVIGQAGALFIIAEGPDGVYMVDQHAAHERVLYDDLRRQLDAHSVARQPLLEPQLLEMDASEMEAIVDGAALIGELGFAVEAFGNTTCILRAVPGIIGNSSPGETLRELLAEIVSGKDRPESRDRSLATVACKAAVKAGQTLSIEEMRFLVQRLETTESPRTCPHGRPTMILLSTSALERQFGRR